ncbi:MAG: DinB family protein [Balneolaceae bacterium]
MSNRIIRQYHYHQWANNRIFEHLKNLPSDVYKQEITSVFSSVSEVIEHVYQTDAMWLSVMSEDPFEKTMGIIHETQKRIKNVTLQEMQKLYEELSGQYLAFFKGKSDLDETITIEHPQYGSMDTAVTELVQHVVNHGTYHRGNITAMLRQQGEVGVPTDLIFYLSDSAD